MLDNQPLFNAGQNFDDFSLMCVPMALECCQLIGRRAETGQRINLAFEVTQAKPAPESIAQRHAIALRRRKMKRQ